MKRRKEKKDRCLTVTGYDDMELPDWAEGPDRAAINNELRGAI